MTEVSLREHLAEVGWDFENLSPGGDIARVGRCQGASCFEPFGAVRRALSARRLPIHQALPIGTRIKFLSSLKFDVLPNPTLWHCITHPLHGLIWVVLVVVTKLSGQSVSDFDSMTQLEGDVALYTNPLYSEFPFDQPLTITNVGSYAVSLLTDDGKIWMLSASSFATVKQITILKQ